MTHFDHLKLELKKMIADSLGNVLKKLDQVLDDKSTDCYNNFIMLTMEFKQWDTRQIQAAQTAEVMNLELRNLTHRLLRFIDGLEAADILQTAYLKEEIYEKILVVCKAPERVAYMQKFFPPSYFKNVNYDGSGIHSLPNGYDIVLFDNYPQEPEPDEDGKNELLKHYLQEQPLLLYFGANLPLLYKFPEKAYATNSVFSLHARIFEMINYIKYTKVV